nr:hypothetical protein Iba_scaffold79259CG0010 [Ipomoea batatas]
MKRNSISSRTESLITPLHNNKSNFRVLLPRVIQSIQTSHLQSNERIECRRSIEYCCS